MNQDTEKKAGRETGPFPSSYLQLGEPCTHRPSGQRGILTSLAVFTSGEVLYWFQPEGLDKNGLSKKTKYTTRGEIEDLASFHPLFFPLETLGTQARDKNSGYAGEVKSLNLHINGCVHLELQAKGMNTETGDAFKPQEFDIRRLEGEAIPVLSKEELSEDRQERPSPEAGGSIPSAPGGEARQLP